MIFSLSDFIGLQSRSEFFFPKNFISSKYIDRNKYNRLEIEHKKIGLEISQTFHELRSRTGNTYYRKVYPAQSSALNFSETVFPAYRFLMPDVLVDDWLSIVDFHKKYSRDHALHQPLTAYIIFRILGGGNSCNSILIHGKSMLDICTTIALTSPKTKYLRNYFLNLYPNSHLFDESKQSYEVWKQILFETAMIAAVFHDIGYPWQYINRLNTSIKTSDFNLEQGILNARYIIDRFSNRLIMYPFHGYQLLTNIQPSNWKDSLLDLISNALSNTHGFPGALGFLYLNDLTRKYPKLEEKEPSSFCIEWAALAIMMHDMKEIYKGNAIDTPENKFMRLSMDTDPLSCIITLADVLQDFERPTVKFDIQSNGSIFNYDFSCETVSMNIVHNTMNINYAFKEENQKIINKSFKAKDEKDYFHKDSGYVDLSSIGINEVKLSCI